MVQGLGFRVQQDLLRRIVVRSRWCVVFDVEIKAKAHDLGRWDKIPRKFHGKFRRTFHRACWESYELAGDEGQHQRGSTLCPRHCGELARQGPRDQKLGLRV